MNEAYYQNIRESVSKTPIKSRKLSIDNNVYEVLQSKEDSDNQQGALEIINIYNQEDGGCSNNSINGSFFKKKLYNIEQQKHLQRRHQSSSHYSDNTSKNHSRMHSTDISSAGVNKQEGKILKGNLEEKRLRIALFTKKIKINEEEIKKCTTELNELKAKKEKIENCLPNKLSEKESYEEIYKYNINKYSKTSNSKGRYFQMPSMSPCSMDNVSVSKHEITIFSPSEFKGTVISIINDLFINSKYEVLYQNLIEGVITKAFASLGSTMTLGKGDLFFVKLSKGICDIYPTLNYDALIILLKNTVKLNYIEAMIAKDLLFIKKDFKKQEKELKDKLQELNETEVKLESYLNNLRDNEMEFMTQLDLIADSSDKTTANTSNILRESIKKQSFHYEDLENEESFENKGGNKDYSNNLLSNLILTQKKSAIQHEINRIDIGKKIKEYSKQYEDSDTKSSFRRSCSNKRGAYRKNDDSSSWISDEKMTHLNIKESPIRQRIQNQRTKSVLPIHKKNVEIITNFHNKNNNNAFIHSTFVQDSMKSLMRNRSDNNIFVEENETPFIFSLSNNELKLAKTFCYYKFINKSDPKFNPFHPQANNPDSLGYEKALISYDNHNETLCIKSMVEKSRRHTIKSSSIQNTIIMNLMKDIITIFKSYQTTLQYSNNEPIDINSFIQQNEFNSIDLDNNDRIKATLCSSFSFSILLNSNERIELLFVNYNEFKVWFDGISSMFNKN